MRNYGVGWSGDAHLLWEGEVGEAMKTTLSIQNEGRYRLAVRLTKAPDYRFFSSFLDGTKLREGSDLYDPRVALDKEIDLGVVDVKAGSHDRVLKLTGANPKAKKFKGKLQLMGLDYLKLVNLAPPKPVVTQKPKLVPKTEKLVVTLAEMRPVMATYCFKCHGDKEKVKGKVNLKKLTTREAFLADIELTRKVAEALAYQEMPPEDEEQLPEAVHRKLSALFDGILAEYLKASGTLRPVVMRRMNRYEYNNAVRDLLKLKGDPYPLPEKVLRGGNYFHPASGKFPDAVRVSNRALGKNQIEQHILTGVTPFAIDLQAEHGFNNRGDELSVSPILLESFLKLGRSIVNSREFDRYSGIAGTFFAAPRDRKSVV